MHPHQKGMGHPPAGDAAVKDFFINPTHFLRHTECPLIAFYKVIEVGFNEQNLFFPKLRLNKGYPPFGVGSLREEPRLQRNIIQLCPRIGVKYINDGLVGIDFGIQLYGFQRLVDILKGKSYNVIVS